MPDTTHPAPLPDPIPIPIVLIVPAGRYVWSRRRGVVHVRACVHVDRIAPRNAAAADKITACADGRPCMICQPAEAAAYGYRRGGAR